MQYPKRTLPKIRRIVVLSVVLFGAELAEADNLRVGAAAVELQADDSMIIGGSIHG